MHRGHQKRPAINTQPNHPSTKPPTHHSGDGPFHDKVERHPDVWEFTARVTALQIRQEKGERELQVNIGTRTVVTRACMHTVGKGDRLLETMA